MSVQGGPDLQEIASVWVGTRCKNCTRPNEKLSTNATHVAYLADLSPSLAWMSEFMHSQWHSTPIILYRSAKPAESHEAAFTSKAVMSSRMRSVVACVNRNTWLNS